MEDGQFGLQSVEHVPIDGPLAQTRSNLFVQYQGSLKSFKLSESSIVRLTTISPSLIPGSAITQIASGDSHAMALSKDGFLFTWGSSSNGRLGQGKTCLDLQGPKVLYSLANYSISFIACGFSHSIAIGASRSTGPESTPDSDSNETDSYFSAFSSLRGSNQPPIPKGPRVFVWGNGMYGALGTGDCNDLYEPGVIEFFDKKEVKDVSGGDYFTIVLANDGQIYSFGSNSNGQLGIGEGAVNRSTPQAVKLVQKDKNPEPKKAIKIAAGSTHSLVLDSEGAVWSWGTNFHGECGHGSGSVRESVPKVSFVLKKHPEFNNFSNVFLFAGRHVSVLVAKDKNDKSKNHSFLEFGLKGSQTPFADLSLLNEMDKGAPTSSKKPPRERGDHQKNKAKSSKISHLKIGNFADISKFKETSSLNVNESINPEDDEDSKSSSSEENEKLSSFSLLKVGTPGIPRSPNSSFIQRNNRIFSSEVRQSPQDISSSFPIIENDKPDFSLKSKETISPLKDILKTTMKPETAEKLTQHWLTRVFPYWGSLRASPQLKTEIKQGVPLGIRGKLWCHLIGNKQGITNSLYAHLTKQEAEKDAKGSVALEMDLSRTFIHLRSFQEPNMASKLSKVLLAFSLYRPDIGYVQGMNYLAAVLLLYMDEFPAFCCLANIICDLFMLGFFTFDENLISVRLRLFKVAMEHNIKDLVSHFEREGFHPKMFAFEWILTLFSTILEINSLCFVWDYLFLYGYSFTFELAIAILKLNKKELIKMDIVQASNFFKNSSKKIDPLKIIRKTKKVVIQDWIRKELIFSNYSFIPN